MKWEIERSNAIFRLNLKMLKSPTTENYFLRNTISIQWEREKKQIFHGSINDEKKEKIYFSVSSARLSVKTVCDVTNVLESLTFALAMKQLVIICEWFFFSYLWLATEAADSFFRCFSMDVHKWKFSRNLD